MFRFTSDGLAPREQSEVFAAALHEGLAKVHVEPSTTHPFRAQIAIQMLGGLPVGHIAGSGYRVARTGADLARSSVDAYFVQFRLHGGSHIRNGHADTAVGAGDIFLLDTRQPFDLALDQPFGDLVVKIPKRWIAARFAQPDCLAGRVVPRSHPLTPVLTEYVAATWHSASKLSPSATAMFAQHLLDLLAEATNSLQANAPPPLAARRAALFAYARRVIALKFSDPELDPDAIARTMGVTTRTLHRLFAAHGESVMKTVLAERVQHAANLLVAPAAHGRTITEIAFACGFNDLTHFGRAFEAEMHMTPSQWRRRV